MSLLNPRNFQGKIFEREPLTGELSEWVAHTYQYAYSSIDDINNTLNPAYIIYVAGDEDIYAAIEYAIENDLAIAVRTGGHQYNGASSTFGNNIQIDLSGKLAKDPKRFPYKKIEFKEEDNAHFATLGCGVSLGEISSLLEEKGLFFPRGECATVHVGGHSNTGGMSAITPAFGAMIDHITSFNLICSKYPSNKKNITRPDLWDEKNPNGLPKEENDDLFWAVLGGSPGNFGIVTDITIKCLKDRDYPHSRGLKLAWSYSKETVEQLAQIVCEVSDNVQLSASTAISMLIVGAEYFYPERHPSGLLLSTGEKTLDDKMLQKYPELAGKDHFNYLGEKMVAIYGIFLNPTGTKNYEQQLANFENIRDRLLSIPGCITSPDKIKILNKLAKGVEFVERKVLKKEKWAKKTEKFIDSLAFDTLMYGEAYCPMSKIMRNFNWNNPREFSLPYKKLSFIGDSREMSKPNPKLSVLPVMKNERSEGQRFSTWLANEVAFVFDHAERFHGMYLAIQIGVLGGPGLSNPSKFGGSRDYTSLAHRDANFWFDYDVFYNPTIEGCTQLTTEYIDQIAKTVVNNTLNLFKNGKQNRVLLGPSFPFGEQPILDKYWEYFYDNNKQYNRLCELKNKYDEKNVFTPNLFCVGASRIDRMQKSLYSLLEKEAKAKGN